MKITNHVSDSQTTRTKQTGSGEESPQLKPIPSDRRCSLSLERISSERGGGSLTRRSAPSSRTTKRGKGKRQRNIKKGGTYRTVLVKPPFLCKGQKKAKYWSY